MSAYSDLILAHGADLWGYWRLGESSGTNANDETANNRDGTYGGATLGQPGALAGDADTAVSLPGGSGSFIKGSVIGPANALFSLEVWAKRSAAGVIHTLFCNGENQGWEFYFHSDNTLRLGMRGVGDVMASTVTVANTNWHHIVCTRDTGASPTTKLYIDGVDRSGSITARTLVGASPWLVGSRTAAGGSNGFIGLLDEAAIYTVALTPTQVAAHYNMGVASRRKNVRHPGR